MSIRWRATGDLICGAVSQEEPGDTYIDDRLQYQLAVISRAIVPDVDEENSGLHHWVHGDFIRGAKI